MNYLFLLFIILKYLSASPTSVCQTTTLGASPGTPCVFPFTYQGVQYNECITVDNNGVPWCSLTPDYDSDLEYGNCAPTLKTTNGNVIPGTACVFPFTFNGIQYNKCITEYNTIPWCATTSNYDWDLQWGNCDCTDSVVPTFQITNNSKEKKKIGIIMYSLFAMFMCLVCIIIAVKDRNIKQRKRDDEFNLLDKSYEVVSI